MSDPRNVIPVKYEVGTISIQESDGWVDIEFENTYSFPIVIASIASTDDTTPCSVSVNIYDDDFNVRHDGAAVSLYEPSNEAGNHGIELVAYFVIEGIYGGKGSSTLPTGDKFECGIEFGVTYDSSSTINFESSFTTTPIVLACILNEEAYSIIRLNSVSTSSFDARVFAGEGQAYTADVIWIALESNTFDLFQIGSSTSIEGITDGWSTVNLAATLSETPVIISQCQTYNSNQPGRIAIDNVTTSSFDAVFLEDTVADSEQSHTSETVGYLAAISPQVYAPSIEQPKQDYGFRVSLPGFDVTDPNLDPENLIFSTEFSSPQILAEGTGSLTIPSTGMDSSVWTLNHNYGVPLAYLIYYKAYVAAIGEYAYFLSPMNFDPGAFGFSSVAISDSGLYAEDMCDANNIKFKIRTSDSGYAGNETDLEFKYYILAEPLTDFSGNLPKLDLDYGFKIAKPGYDVLTGKEQDMSFSSSRKFFKLKEIIRESVGIPGINVGQQEIRIAYPHNLGYFPAFWAYTTGSVYSSQGTYDTPFYGIIPGATATTPPTEIIEAYTTKDAFYYRIARQAGYGTGGGGPYLTPWGPATFDFTYILTHEKLGS